MTKAIDMLCGWGGFTEAAQATGIKVVFGLNHSESAIEGYRLNHPQARAVCGDARHYDYRSLPDFDLLLASPSCKPKSNASQPGRKRASDRLRSFHDEQRVTPWCVLDCIECCRPRMFVIENVIEFQTWDLYQRWRACLIDLGYGVAEHRILASRHGVPQRRLRLFITGVHRKPALRYTDPKVVEPAIGPYLQWDMGDWTPVAAASRNVQERIEAGRRRHGDRFITQHVTGHKGISLREPIRTITTQDQFALVNGDTYRPLTLRETARAMGFRDSFVWPAELGRREVIEGFGNAVSPPAATDLIRALQHHEGNTTQLRAS